MQIAGAALLLVLDNAVVIALAQPAISAGGLAFLPGNAGADARLAGVGYQGKQGIADRYAYLPFIGLFIMISWGVADLG